jgi:hypothetical protein
MIKSHARSFPNIDKLAFLKEKELHIVTQIELTFQYYYFSTQITFHISYEIF